jgi:hypothetical protein
MHRSLLLLTAAIIFIVPMLNSVAQVPGLSAEPQISIDCVEYDSDEYLAYGSGFSWIDCDVTNEESKRIKVEVKWTEEFKVVTMEDIDNRDEVTLESDATFELTMLISATKMEPGELDFRIEFTVTESEEFNGWQTCDDCETHEFEVTYKLSPWAEITNVEVTDSTVPGMPAGSSYSNNRGEPICSEELLSDLTITVEADIDASQSNRDSMYFQLNFKMQIYFLSDPGAYEPEIFSEATTTESVPIDWQNTTTVSLDFNLDAVGNRSEENWRVFIVLESSVYLDSYGRMKPNSVIDTKPIWSNGCQLPFSVEDPDANAADEREDSSSSLPSTGVFTSLVAVLLAAVRRGE